MVELGFELVSLCFISCSFHNIVPAKVAESSPNTWETYFPNILAISMVDGSIMPMAGGQWQP